MKKGKQGINSILAVMRKKHDVAFNFLEKGQCQIKDCKEKSVKVVSSINGYVLALCETHCNIIKDSK